MEFGRQGALQNASCEGWVSPLDHTIQVYCCFPFHGVLDLVQLFPHVSHHLVTTTSWLRSMLWSAILWTMSLVIVVIAIASRLRHNRSLWAHLLLQFFILFHQFLHVSGECLNLLDHYDWIHRRRWSGSVHVSRGTLLVEIRWWLAWENCKSIFSSPQTAPNWWSRNFPYQYVPRQLMDDL